jgi:hypothetical protein
MIEFNHEQTPPIPNEMLMLIIQMNEVIVRQNALIVQALTMPVMMLKEKQ